MSALSYAASLLRQCSVNEKVVQALLRNEVYVSAYGGPVQKADERQQAVVNKLFRKGYRVWLIATDRFDVECPEIETNAYLMIKETDMEQSVIRMKGKSNQHFYFLAYVEHCDSPKNTQICHVMIKLQNNSVAKVG